MSGQRGRGIRDLPPRNREVDQELIALGQNITKRGVGERAESDPSYGMVSSRGFGPPSAVAHSILDGRPPVKRSRTGQYGVPAGPPATISLSLGGSRELKPDDLEVFTSTVPPQGPVSERVDRLLWLWRQQGGDFVGALSETVEILCMTERFTVAKESAQVLLALSEQLPQAFVEHGAVSLLARCFKLRSPFSGRRILFAALSACQIYWRACREVTEWPLIFVDLFADDSLGDRVWVDHELARSFVAGIATITGPRPKADQQPLLRFQQLRENVREDIVLDLLKRMGRPQLPPAEAASSSSGGRDRIRGVLRTLAMLTAHPSARLLAAEYLEFCSAGPQATRFGKDSHELLSRVAEDTWGTHTDDLKVVEVMVRTRLRRPLLQYSLSGSNVGTSVGEGKSDPLIDMLGHQWIYCRTALHVLLHWEVSTAGPSLGTGMRATQLTNPKLWVEVLRVLDRHSHEPGVVVGQALRDLALVEGETQRVRYLAKRILRVGAQGNFKIRGADVVRGVLLDSTASGDWNCDSAKRFVMLCADLAAFVLTASVPRVLVDPSPNPSRTESLVERSTAAAQEFVTDQLLEAQMHVVAWCHDVVGNIIGETKPVVGASVGLMQELLRRGLLLAKDSEIDADEWRASVAHTRLSEKLITNIARLVLFPHSLHVPLTSFEAFDVLDSLLKRAALSRGGDKGEHILLANSNGIASTHEMIDVVLKLSFWTPPPMIRPHFNGELLRDHVVCVVELYWRAICFLVVAAACAPATLGSVLWHELPTARYLIEQIVSQSLGNAHDDIVEGLPDEREQEFGFRLEEGLRQAMASAGMDVDLPSVEILFFDPRGPVRKPPQSVVEYLLGVESKLHLRQLLCASRQPDFFLEVLGRQGAARAVSWVVGAVNNDPHLVDFLPVRALCELLASLFPSGADNLLATLIKKRLSRLCSSHTVRDRVEALTVLQFFLDMQKSYSVTSRRAGRKILNILASEALDLVQSVEDVSEGGMVKSHRRSWLTDLPKLPFAMSRASAVQDIVRSAVVEAVLVEHESEPLFSFVLYIADWVCQPTDYDSSEIIAAGTAVATLVASRIPLVTGLWDRPGFAEAVVSAILEAMKASGWEGGKGTHVHSGHLWAGALDVLSFHRPPAGLPIFDSVVCEIAGIVLNSGALDTVTSTKLLTSPVPAVVCTAVRQAPLQASIMLLLGQSTFPAQCLSFVAEHLCHGVGYLGDEDVSRQSVQRMFDFLTSSRISFRVALAQVNSLSSRSGGNKQIDRLRKLMHAVHKRYESRKCGHVKMLDFSSAVRSMDSNNTEIPVVDMPSYDKGTRSSQSLVILTQSLGGIFLTEGVQAPLDTIVGAIRDLATRRSPMLHDLLLWISRDWLPKHLDEDAVYFLVEEVVSLLYGHLGTSSLLVRGLIEMDPCISFRLWRDVLFCGKKPSISSLCRRAFLVQAATTGDWSTLRQHIEWLQMRKTETQLDRAAVLDYISACWLRSRQSREDCSLVRTGAVGDRDSDGLHFSAADVRTLYDLAAVEAEEGKVHPKQIALIAHAAVQNPNNLRTLDEVLCADHRVDHMRLAACVYATLPFALTKFPRPFLHVIGAALKDQTSLLDVDFERAVLGLLDVKRTSASYLTLLRLTRLHASLTMRHVETLGALIRGAEHLSAEEFDHNQWTRVYLHVVAVLSSMGVAAFEAPGFPSVAETLLLRIRSLNGGNTASLEHFVSTVSQFLSDYAVSYPAVALSLMSPFVDVLAEMKERFAFTQYDSVRVQVYPTIASVSLLHSLASAKSLREVLAADRKKSLDTVGFSMTGEEMNAEPWEPLVQVDTAPSINRPLSGEMVLSGLGSTSDARRQAAYEELMNRIALGDTSLVDSAALVLSQCFLASSPHVRDDALSGAVDIFLLGGANSGTLLDALVEVCPHSIDTLKRIAVVITM